MPRISVVVPIYNGEQYLKRCVDSVLEQTYKDIEVLLVNDGSTDGSLEILREYEQKDSRVKVIDKPNTGVSLTRNAGIDASEGEYIFFIDCDDWIDFDTLEFLLSHAETRGTEITGCGFCMSYPNGEEKHFDEQEKFIDDTREFVMWTLSGGLAANAAWGKLYKSDRLKARFDAQYDICEDDDFSFRVAKTAESYLRLPDAKYHYFQNYQSGAVLSNSIVSQKPIDVTTAIIEDPFVKSDPELLNQACCKKISAIYMTYYKCLKLNDRKGAKQLASQMHELVKEHGYCGTSQIMKIRIKLMRFYALSRFAELALLRLKVKSKT